jgi:hypothetical protein
MYGILNDTAGDLTPIAGFVAPLKMISNKPVFVSDALSLKRATYARAAQRWELETNLEPLVGAANNLLVNLVTKGITGTVYVLVPQNYGVIAKRSATTSTMTVVTTTAVNSGVSSLSVICSVAGEFIPAGTFIKINNGGTNSKTAAGLDTKIYMTTADFTGTTTAKTLQIYPPLRVGIALNTGDVTVYHRDDVVMPCFYDTSTVIGMSYTDGILMDMGSVKFVENLK